MSRQLGFNVPYQEDDNVGGDYGEMFAKTQFIPLTAIETIYQVNGGYWERRTLAGNTYSFASLNNGAPDTPTIEELTGVADDTEIKDWSVE